MGAGKCLGSGAAGSVFAAEWDGAPVAIKVPTESHHCSLDDARQLLQHEEAAYRYLGEHLEGCPGALAVRRPCVVELHVFAAQHPPSCEGCFTSRAGRKLVS